VTMITVSEVLTEIEFDVFRIFVVIFRTFQAVKKHVPKIAPSKD
jgi:hypothetical protein